MIITLNGEHGAGKSTLATRLAQELDYDYYYTGDIFRQMAKDRGITLVELLKIGESDKSIDNEVDDKTVEIGKTKDNFIFDSRLAWHFIPQSLKILLKVDEQVAAERMFKHLKEGESEERKNEDKERKTAQDILESNRRRKASDEKRYKEYYGVDIWDEGNYDFVLDTTDLSIEQAYDKLHSFVKESLENEKQSDQKI